MWKRHVNGRIERGDGEPPADTQADLHFIDTVGSRAIIKGRLYVDGVLAAKGEYPIPFKGGVMIVEVNGWKKVKGRRVERGGDRPNGPDR